MPELPEVETIRRQLFKEVVGKKIKSVEIKLPKMVYFDGRRSDVKNFKKNLEGARVNKANRAAKILIIELSNGYTLLIHLKLTGQLIYRAKNGETKRGGNPRTKRAEPRLGKSLAGLLFVSQSLCSWTNREQSSYNEPPWPKPNVSVPNKWTHAIIHFTDGSKLYFNDLRQFGYLKLIETKKIGEQKELKKLGPEPLDKNFTAEKFSEMLKKRGKAKIKPLLLDQNFLSGIGNIYADESLFYAGILPTRPAGKLKPEEIKKLHQGIKTILQKSIAQGGTSSDTYVTLTGQKGGYEKYLKVYGWEGEKCKRGRHTTTAPLSLFAGCDGIIKRIKLSSRSAHFCPKCQI